MIKAFKDLSGSKKAVVYVFTALLMAAVLFGGVDPEAANSFTDKLYKLAMAYLGGQGLADLGKYAGEAYGAGKEAVASRDTDKLDNPDEFFERLDRLEELDKDKLEKLAEAASALKEKAESKASESAKDEGGEEA